jgi:F0F1-type ATP synthase assembly protein I
LSGGKDNKRNTIRRIAKMRSDEKENEKQKEKKRKPYQKPALTAEELFEATVLGCAKETPYKCSQAMTT